jgi:hypothetical protein
MGSGTVCSFRGEEKLLDLADDGIHTYCVRSFVPELCKIILIVLFLIQFLLVAVIV